MVPTLNSVLYRRKNLYTNTPAHGQEVIQKFHILSVTHNVVGHLGRLHDTLFWKTNTKSIFKVLKLQWHMIRKMDKAKKEGRAAGLWWHTPLIPGLARQRQSVFSVWGQPGLQGEFQDSQDYTVRPSLRKKKCVGQWPGVIWSLFYTGKGMSARNWRRREQK